MNTKFTFYRYKRHNTLRYFRVEDNSRRVLQLVVREQAEGRGNRKNWIGIYYITWAGFCTSYFHFVFKKYLKHCTQKEFNIVFKQLAKQMITS